MKTLIVSYLPRKERSHTRKLLEAFLEEAEGQDIEHLNLIEDLPDVFLPGNLNSYVKRNYLGEALDSSEQAGMEKMDRMTRQLKEADALVLVFPMHNFSMPALVKAWFDSVMQKGQTWTVTEDGYAPLLTGRKALVLMASGGLYEGGMASFNHATSLAEVQLGFMGYETQTVTAGGMNVLADPEGVVETCANDVRSIANDWYRKQEGGR